ncbi:hypothetical protein Lal_00003504 [Lupinus albus]|nr:hypothetical protein Lal_00003504 [Lupinus albus]
MTTIVLKYRKKAKSPIPFRINNCWFKHPKFPELVKRTWLETRILGWFAFVVKEKLMCLKLKLKAWNRESFGCLDSKLIEHSKDVNSIVLEGELGDLEVQQVMLRKKSNPTIDGVDFNMLSESQVFELEGAFSKEELKDVLWNCASDKSLGPDGFNFKFYQEFWDILKIDLGRFVNDFHMNGLHMLALENDVKVVERETWINGITYALQSVPKSIMEALQIHDSLCKLKKGKTWWRSLWFDVIWSI